MNNVIEIKSPCDKKIIRFLKAGDNVKITGKIVTGRDAFHKFVMDKYVKTGNSDEQIQELKELLNNAFLYHCGPVMQKFDNQWKFLVGGPTTSLREEPYEADIIKYFNLNGVIGKGGMGDKTLKALKNNSSVYLHATGGAAALIGKCVKSVEKVFFLDLFGIPEAAWVLNVIDFPCTVTMDTKGNSLHKMIYEKSYKKLLTLFDTFK